MPVDTRYNEEVCRLENLRLINLSLRKLHCRCSCRRALDFNVPFLAARTVHKVQVVWAERSDEVHFVAEATVVVSSNLLCMQFYRLANGGVGDLSGFSCLTPVRPCGVGFTFRLVGPEDGDFTRVGGREQDSPTLGRPVRIGESIP